MSHLGPWLCLLLCYATNNRNGSLLLETFVLPMRLWRPLKNAWWVTSDVLLPGSQECYIWRCGELHSIAQGWGVRNWSGKLQSLAFNLGGPRIGSLSPGCSFSWGKHKRDTSSWTRQVELSAITSLRQHGITSSIPIELKHSVLRSLKTNSPERALALCSRTC